MDEVRVERRRQGVWLTLNRPAYKNALSSSMLDAIAETFEAASVDSAVKYLVIQATGADFCTGGDLGVLSDFVDLPPDERGAQIASLAAKYSHRIFLAMDRLPQPVLCVVRGRAIGAGAQLAFGADLVIASQTASFSVPQTLLAHTPDHGESYHLPRKCGMARAMQILLLGDRISAEKAETMNIVNWVVDDAQLEEAAADLAGRLETAPALAVQTTKALVKRSLDNDLERQLLDERDAVVACAQTPNFVEALRAFSEKRPPKYV